MVKVARATRKVPILRPWFPLLTLLAVLFPCLPASAQETAPAEGTQAERSLSEIQQSISARYQRFAKTLTQLHGYMKETDPARAEEMLARVAETGRRAIGETGRLLHVIRDADDELGLAPTPGLRDLDDLVREFERDGLEVELVVDGLPEQVPAAVDVSAYRVVREALTNALRYAPDRRVRVEVAGTDAGLTIRTVNRAGGGARVGSGLGSGLGLAGLAERVEMLGGTIRHGPTPAGEFELVASVPA